MKKKSLTKEEILHLAKLAGLSLNNKEIEKYRGQLTETISYIENLNELPTDDISPTSHTTALSNVFFKDEEKNTRGLNLVEIFQNTKSKEKKYFKVKKILDE